VAAIEVAMGGVALGGVRRMAVTVVSRRARATVESRQAKGIVSLLPTLMRMLSTFDNDPGADLPLAQLRVCSILCSGPHSMSALSREFGVSLSAMTRIADRLERARLVKRVAEGDDRRIRQLQLTPRGKRIMQQRDEARVRSVAAVLTHLSAKERKEVRNSLATLMSACTAMNGRGEL
jgi:DNA-binding MarR family transcriptional regulator